MTNRRALNQSRECRVESVEAGGTRMIFGEINKEKARNQYTQMFRKRQRFLTYSALKSLRILTFCMVKSLRILTNVQKNLHNSKIFSTFAENLTSNVWQKEFSSAKSMIICSNGSITNMALLPC